MKKKILLISNLPITDKNAGPAIRYINITKVLSKNYECCLFSHKCSNEQKKKYSFLQDGNIFKYIKELKNTDIVINQPSRFRYLFLARLFKKKIIIDLYDPTDVENLEMYKQINGVKSKLVRMYSKLRLVYALKLGDYFVCANEIQKDYWIGYLQAVGRITMNEYNKNNKLDHIIGYLPYGIEESVNEIKNNPILNISKEIKKQDKIIIWAGGIWNWFDSQNLIYAMKNIYSKRNDIKLLFLGIPTNYSKEDPKFKNLSQTIELSKELDVYNKNVFFNNEWVDYEKRNEYLANSYIGISLHYDNLETRYSFRTRILDYLWMDLPFVASKNDYFDQLNGKYNISETVECNSAEAIEQGILELIDNKKEYSLKKKNIIAIKDDFLWENTCRDLIKNIESEVKSSSKIGIITSITYILKAFCQIGLTAFRKDF